MNEQLYFTILEHDSLTEVYRVPASDVARIAPGSDTIQ